MRNLFTWAAARIVAAFALTLPLAAIATSTYSTDHTVTGSETAYTSSAGNANVTWQNFNFRAAVDKDNLAHGYYFYLKDGDTDIGETDVAVKLDSITLTWGSGTGGGIASTDTPYLVVTTADDSPVIIGVSAAGDAFAVNGTSTFTFTDVVLASNAKYRFYFYKNDVSGLSVGATLTGATNGRVNGRYHNTSGDARKDYNDICCNGGAGYSVNCSFVVSPVAQTEVISRETGATAVALAGGNSSLPVVIEGKVADGVVEIGSAANVEQIVTVDGVATTLQLADSLTATAFYFPAAVTVDASNVSGLDPTGDDVSKTTALLSGALKYTTAPVVALPAASAGMLYQTNVTGSGITVTVTKGVDCTETISQNTSWSSIKPAGWVDSSVGDKPAITISYEGTEPVTLTFGETVAAGSLTLTGNIVVEATAAATFGTVTAGAGSVVEMANMTITTQSGTGTYRYRSNYPSQIPSGKTYEYVGGASVDATETVSGQCDSFGYLKTSGYITFSDFAFAAAATLDVLSGKTSANCGEDKLFKGAIYIRENATFANLRAADALNYDGDASVYVYGTLDLGATRWSIGNSNKVYVYGGSVIGSGQTGNGAALDWIESASDARVNVSGAATISAPVKIRSGATVRFDVPSGNKLTISGTTIGVGNVSKSSAGKLIFTSNPTYSNIIVGNGTLEFDTESDVNQVVTYYDMKSTYDMGYTTNSNWKGTIVINTIDVGATATQVALNKIGNQNSYLTLNGISGNAWCAGSTFIVQPAVTLAGDVNFENGGSGSAVTFRKIAAGTGNLSLKSWSTCTGITYGFTTLDADNYTGTIQLDGSVLTFNVGDILKANAQPSNETPILPLTVANNATVNLANATVNGESANLALKADGIYLIPTVTITVPVVANTTIEVSVGGETVAPATEGELTNTYSVVEGSTVTVTYSSDDYEVTGGTFEFAASENYTVDAAGVTTAPYVAQIKVGVAEYEKYTSVAQALTSENVYRGITLLGNATEGTLDITQQYVMLTGAGYTLTADITVGASTTFVPYNVTLDGDLTVNGVYNQMGTVAVTGDLTTGDGARLQFSTLGTDVAALTVGGDIAVNGALTLTPNSTSSLTTGVAYKTLNGATVTLAEGASVTLGTIEGAILGYVVEPNETTTLTIKIPAAKVGEDDYHDTFASARAAAAGVGVITLLKDVSSVVTNYNTQTGYITSIVTNDLVTIAADEVLKVNANGYVICVGLAAGLTPPEYALSTVMDGNVAIYSVLHGVAVIGNEPYPSLADAFANAQGGDTIKVIADNTLTGGISVTTNLTLDLNGFTVTGAADDKPMFNLDPNVDFTITDTSEDKDGRAVSEASKVIFSGSPKISFTLAEGTVESTASLPIYFYYGGEVGSRVVNINGGKLVSGISSSGNGDFCVMNDNGTVNMRAGEIDSTCGGIRGNNAYVSGGTVTAAKDVLYYDPAQNQSITGGTFNKDVNPYCPSGYAAFEETSGIWTVREAYAEGQTVYLADGSLELTGKQADWLKAFGDKTTVSNALESVSSESFNSAYLLNLDVTGEFSYEFKVTNINVVGEDVTLTVSLTRTGTLDETTKINGTVALTGTDELGKEFETISEATVADEDFSEGSTTTITLDKGDAKFFQPVIK